VEGGDRKLLKRVILDVENYIIYLQLAIMNKEMMYLYSLLSDENYLDYYKGKDFNHIDKNDTDRERISIELDLQTSLISNSPSQSYTH